MRITLLRLDHRIVRDQRITSHVALTARALGTTQFIYTGERDENMEESLADVASRWGGEFRISYSERTKSLISNFEGVKVHLTMYGEEHNKTISTLKQSEIKNLLLIVGGAKVPSYVYSIVDFNTAIGWQPHSEVAATGIFLYALNGDTYLYTHYDDATIALDGSGHKAQRSERFTTK